MKTRDKLKTVLAEAQKVEGRLGNAFGIAGAEETDAILRRFIRSEYLILWDVAVFWQEEAKRCHEAGAHFSAMISSVSMNEALLSSMCLMQEQQVRETAQFRGANQEELSESMKSVLSRWSLKPLIAVASEMQWLPASLIDPKTRELLQQAFEEVLSAPIPGEFSTKALEWRQALEQDAGLTMLQITQDLRNYVHPNRWLARQAAVDTESFLYWCQIATKLSSEVCAVLTFRSSELAAMQREKELSAFMEMVNGMSPERYTMFIETLRLMMMDVAGFEIDAAFGINEFLNLFIPSTSYMHS